MQYLAQDLMLLGKSADTGETRSHPQRAGSGKAVTTVQAGQGSFGSTDALKIICLVGI